MGTPRPLFALVTVGRGLQKHDVKMVRRGKVYSVFDRIDINHCSLTEVVKMAARYQWITGPDIGADTDYKYGDEHTTVYLEGERPAETVEIEAFQKLESDQKAAAAKVRAEADERDLATYERLKKKFES